MAEDTKYNGWTNYETWCVDLWLSNDEGTYNDVLSLVQDAIEEAEPDNDLPGVDGVAMGIGGRTLVGYVADAIRDYTEELPECAAVQETASFVADLLGAALSEVDWYEIATNWIEGEAQ